MHGLLVGWLLCHKIVDSGMQDVAGCYVRQFICFKASYVLWPSACLSKSSAAGLALAKLGGFSCLSMGVLHG